MKSKYRIEGWKELYPPQAAMMRLLLNNDGYEVNHWSDRPGMICAPHFHDEDQSHWVISGRLELTIERVGTFELGPGDRDFMPAKTRHSTRVIGDEPVSYLIGIKRK